MAVSPHRRTALLCLPTARCSPPQSILWLWPFLTPKVPPCHGRDPSTLLSFILLQDNEEKVQPAQKPHTDKVWADPEDTSSSPTRAPAHPSSPVVAVPSRSGWLCPSPAAAEGTGCRIRTKAAASPHRQEPLPPEPVALAAACSGVQRAVGPDIPSLGRPGLTQPSCVDGLTCVRLAELCGVCGAEQTRGTSLHGQGEPPSDQPSLRKALLGAARGYYGWGERSVSSVGWSRQAEVRRGECSLPALGSAGLPCPEGCLEKRGAGDVLPLPLLLSGGLPAAVQAVNAEGW